MVRPVPVVLEVGDEDPRAGVDAEEPVEPAGRVAPVPAGHEGDGRVHPPLPVEVASPLNPTALPGTGDARHSQVSIVNDGRWNARSSGAVAY